MTGEVTAALLMLPQPLLETVVSVTPEIRQAGRRGNYAPSMTLCKTRQIKLLATTQNAPLCSYPFCLFSFKAQRKERVILVYLNDFPNSIPLQEVSGVTQREATASFLASAGGAGSCSPQSQPGRGAAPLGLPRSPARGVGWQHFRGFASSLTAANSGFLGALFKWLVPPGHSQITTS